MLGKITNYDGFLMYYELISTNWIFFSTLILNNQIAINLWFSVNIIDK